MKVLLYLNVYIPISGQCIWSCGTGCDWSCSSQVLGTREFLQSCCCAQWWDLWALWGQQKKCENTKNRIAPSNNVCYSLGKQTFGSWWTATTQHDRYFSQQQLGVLVIAGELSQAGKWFLDTRKTVVLILNNEAVFIIESKRGLWK